MSNQFRSFTMAVRSRSTLVLGVFLSSCLCVNGFSLGPSKTSVYVSHLVLNARRYGPPSTGDLGDGDYQPGDPSDSSSANDLIQEKTRAMQTLIQKVREVTDAQHVPSLLTRNVGLLLSFSPAEMSVCLDSIRKASQFQDSHGSTEDTEEIIDIILSFAQDFCDETARLYNLNRLLLGRIIKAMADTTPDSRREEALDNLLASERSNLTPGFLRHLAGECERIESAPKLTPESLRLLESLRVIQARVVDEMGRDLGEPAQVIMQLLGYETKGERIAILEAGLVVRGIDFARELLTTTHEALNGFQNVPVDVDSELVERVQEINDRTRRFIEEEAVKENDFQ